MVDSDFFCAYKNNMYWKCFLTLSVFCKVVAFVALFTPNNSAWLQSSALGMLAAIIILGNILVYRATTKKISVYCNVGEEWVTVGNIVGHLIVPVVLGTILLCKYAGKQPVTWKTYAKSAGFSVGVGVLYLVLMRAGAVSNYGLDPSTLASFGGAWVVLVLGFSAAASRVLSSHTVA